MKKLAGILCHVLSLLGKYGIGTIDEGYAFVDMLSEMGISVWQILPTNIPDDFNCPYASPSAYANDPLLIGLDTLVNKGYIKDRDINKLKFSKEKRINFKEQKFQKNLLLKYAFYNFKSLDGLKSKEYKNYLKKNTWLQNHAEFYAIRNHLGVPLQKWDEKLKHRDENEIDKYRDKLREEIEFFKFLQYEFYTQWIKLKNYANEKGIQIMGDMPIYVSSDSADVWLDPKVFELDKNLQPINVSGCPPDSFSHYGQKWGTPLYNWDYMKKTNFIWFVERLKNIQNLFDIFRIDHFKGFSEYFSIPYDKDPKDGKWVKASGEELFNEVKKKISSIKIIAEDLGHINQAMKELLKYTGFPGMNVLHFGYQGCDQYLPENVIDSSVTYLGTHDNNTTVGWYENDLTEEERNNLQKKLNIDKSMSKKICNTLIEKALQSQSYLVILTMQDILYLGSEYRINIPGTTCNNWDIIIPEFNKEKVIKQMKKFLKETGRYY